MTNGWWGTSPTVEIPVACSDGEHRLRWEEGALRALDHADADGERVLAALGGDRPPCIAALEAWERHHDDLRVLTLASRGPGDVIRGDVMSRAQWRAMPGGAGAASRPLRSPVARPGRPLRAVGQTGPMRRMPWSEPDDDLLMLYGLSATLWDRLVATVVHGWSERMTTLDRSHPAYPALIAALTGRATMALRAWLGQSDLEVVVEMIAPDARPGLIRDDGRLMARLAFRWLSEIWVPGAVVIFGRFALDRLESRPDLERLLTVGPDAVDLRTVSIRLEPSAAASP